MRKARLGLNQMGPCVDMRSRHKHTSLTQNLAPVDNHLQMKTYFSPTQSPWVSKLLLRTDSMPSSRWPTHNGGSLSHNALSEHFNTNRSFTYILWFPVLCFYGFLWIWMCLYCVCFSCAFSLALFFLFVFFCPILVCFALTYYFYVSCLYYNERGKYNVDLGR